MIILPYTTPYGRGQPLGCNWCNKRPLAGGLPHLPYKGFIHRTFFPSLWPTEFPGHPSGKNIGSSQGTAGLCRGIQTQARISMQSCEGATTMHGPIDDHQWGWCYGGLPVEACGGGIRIFPHPRRGGHPPGQERWALRIPRPCSSTSKNPRFIDPA